MKRLLLILILFLSLFFLYARFINTKGLSIHEYAIKSDKFNNSFDGMKVVHFSDTLIGNTTTISDIENLTSKINQTKSDIIFFTGNLFSKNYKLNDKDINKLTEYLKNMECSLYKYAVLGDEDFENIDQVKIILENANFTILDNKSIYLFYKEINPIKIIGIEDTKKTNDLLVNEEGINPLYNIIITNKSDNIKHLAINDIDLMLSGNSLGGQIRLPFVGGLIKKEGSAQYIDSYYKVNNTDLYISNGIGTTNLKLRSFNKPSFNLYRFSK